ncbi:MAG: T9SS type A sorting domain-containing protein [Sporocytophaga sp.]|nr:T9SS type A sorting domain-containing protein [Sporocytophaga sp.]
MKKLLSKQLASIILVGSIFLNLDVAAQTFKFPTSGSTTITTCSGHLYDDGGADGNYTPDSEGIVTILPENGKFVKLTLNDYTAYFSELEIYFGDNTSAKSITFESFLVSSSGPHDVFYGSPVNGAITLRFKTGYEASGLDFTIECLDEYPLYDFYLSEGSGIPLDTVPKGVNLGTESSPQNASETPTGPYKMSYFISTDKVLDANDLKIYEDVYTSIYKGTFTYINEGVLQIPLEVPVGKYYFFTVMDYDNLFPESDETNNFSIDSIYVIEPTVSASIEDWELTPEANNADNQFAFKFIAESVGELRTITSLDWVIKAGTTKDINNASVRLAEGILTNVDRFWNDESKGSFIPSENGFTQNGTYYIFLQLDPEGKLSLVGESILIDSFKIDNSIDKAFLLPLTGNVVINSCNGFVYDNGGPDNWYKISTDGSLTIYPDSPDKIVVVTLNNASLGIFDDIKIYDGDGGSSSELMEEITDDFTEENKKSFKASGKGKPLTVVLNSMNSFGGFNEGFEAEISCPVIASTRNRLVEELTVGPNPANSFLQINMPKGVNQFTGKVYSNDGKLMKSFSNESILDLADFVSGNYLILLTLPDGSVEPRKFIKR